MTIRIVIIVIVDLWRLRPLERVISQSLDNTDLLLDGCDYNALSVI